eukprot:4850584-Alexandrium_andersonii.AAC.1
MAAGYFQLYTDVMDLMFAEPLQQYESVIRGQVSEICVDSLFGWCQEDGASGRCPRGCHPANGWEAFQWAYTIMMVVCQ